MAVRKIVYEKSLAYVNPELAKQWHPTKNGSLKPTDVFAGSTSKVWWLYHYDVPDDYPVVELRGQHFDFEWPASISHRNDGEGCPFLSKGGTKVWKGFNDLVTVNPELAAQWHPTKNGDLTPIDVTEKSSKEVWWLYHYDVPDDYPVVHLRGKHFDFEWPAKICDRSRNDCRCPFLSGRKVWKGFNDLVTVNPELAAQWHPTKNGDLKPTDITSGYDKKVWWIYHYDVPDDYPVVHLRGKHFDFEWKAEVYHRSYKDGSCPFLAKSNARIWHGFNDLATVNPELAAQWHPTKNGDLTPSEVKSCSNKKVWWMYSYDVPDDYPVKHLRGKHFDFEWSAFINNRNSRGVGCPFLPPSCSMQESQMYMFLMDNNIDFVREFSYKNGKIGKHGKNGSRFDIYLPDYNAVIEVDGRQHFGINSGYYRENFEDLVNLDNERNKFCKDNGIKLLRLPEFLKYEIQNKIVGEFIKTGKISESLAKIYDKYDFSTYGNIARCMNQDGFESDNFLKKIKSDNLHSLRKSLKRSDKGNTDKVTEQSAMADLELGNVCDDVDKKNFDPNFV